MGIERLEDIDAWQLARELTRTCTDCPTSNAFQSEKPTDSFSQLETIKKHLSNIYGKLNVSGRRQAIEKVKNLRIS
jgi:hypothetical protein